MYVKTAEAKDPRRTIETLHLDVDEAMQGRTWLLLPKGFRQQHCGTSYPLPSRREELQIISAIPVPPNKRDVGCLYIKRCIRALKANLTRKQSALLDMEYRETRIQDTQCKLLSVMRQARAEAHQEVEKVRVEAQKAIASLSDLFKLGREGIEGQMKAHLAGEKWQNEPISAKDFRDCFRMVLTGVKGLGLPSEQREKASEAVMDELAAALEDTQSAVALAPGPPAGSQQ